MCLVYGDSVECAFPVDIRKSKLISHLKDKIKEKKAPYFNHIAADELTLYLVDMAVENPTLLKDLKLENNGNEN
ncbi:hypothetical protein BC936DRAFT_142733, partial [Jimgerdemannia flammicorona]